MQFKKQSSKSSKKLRRLLSPPSKRPTREIFAERTPEMVAVFGHVRTSKPAVVSNTPRHIKSGDMVTVIAGSDKGKIGKVVRVLVDKNQVVVEGINRVWKQVRPSQRNPQGGRIQKAAPIHLSKLRPVNSDAEKTAMSINRVAAGM